ncbi:hypothetical protein Tco_1439140 [Tanacetum coccineum]
MPTFFTGCVFFSAAHIAGIHRRRIFLFCGPPVVTMELPYMSVERRGLTASGAINSYRGRVLTNRDGTTVPISTVFGRLRDMLTGNSCSNFAPRTVAFLLECVSAAMKMSDDVPFGIGGPMWQGFWWFQERGKTKEAVLLILECSKIRALKASSRKEKLLTNPRGLNPPPHRLKPGKVLPFEEGFSYQLENKEVVVLEKNDDNYDGEKENEKEEVIT